MGCVNMQCVLINEGRDVMVTVGAWIDTRCEIYYLDST
jgi:hypothetical protein